MRMSEYRSCLDHTLHPSFESDDYVQLFRECYRDFSLNPSREEYGQRGARVSLHQTLWFVSPMRLPLPHVTGLATFYDF